MEEKGKKLNNKYIVAGIVALLILVGVAIYLLGKHHSSPQLSMEIGSFKTCQVNPKNNQVKFTIANASDIKHVSWIFSYSSDIPPSEQVEGATGKINQSLGGEKSVNSSSFGSGYELMGTCSKGICRCDIGVSSVNLDATVTYKDGSTVKLHQTKKI